MERYEGQFIHRPDSNEVIKSPDAAFLKQTGAFYLQVGNDDYYNFTISHSKLEEGVHIANIESLICLKCKAFIEMIERKERGESVDSKHISKHKKDVFRLAAMLTPADRFAVPESLLNDIRKFCDKAVEDLPNADFFKSVGLIGVGAEDLLKSLRISFN